MRHGADPQPDNAEDDSLVPVRPLDLWKEQLDYVRSKPLYDLRDWLETLYDGRPFPVLLSGTDPSVFAIYLYKAGPKEFQQRFRSAMRNLVLSYHPALDRVPYLANLVYVCGQLRIVEAYQTFMELIYSRAFEGKFASDRDRAGGDDVHSHLLAVAGTLRPPHDEAILEYCRRILKEDFGHQYGELAYQILWKADKRSADVYFERFVDTLADRPEVESFERIRKQCLAIWDRYGAISLNGTAQKLLERCTEGPAKDVRVRRARVMLYAILLLLGVEPEPQRPSRMNQLSHARSLFADIDDDYTYEYMCVRLADELKKKYEANSFQSIYGDFPIADAIEVYASTIPCISELESLFTDDNRLYQEELTLVRIAAQRTCRSSESTRDKSMAIGDLFDPKISVSQLIEKLAAVSTQVAP